MQPSVVALWLCLVSLVWSLKTTDLREAPHWYSVSTTGDATAFVLPAGMRQTHSNTVGVGPRDIIGDCLAYSSINPYGINDEYKNQCLDTQCGNGYICVAPLGEARCMPADWMTTEPNDEPRQQGQREDGSVIADEWIFSPTESTNMSNMYQEFANHSGSMSTPSSSRSQSLSQNDQSSRQGQDNRQRRRQERQRDNRRRVAARVNTYISYYHPWPHYGLGQYNLHNHRYY